MSGIHLHVLILQEHPMASFWKLVYKHQKSYHMCDINYDLFLEVAILSCQISVPHLLASWLQISCNLRVMHYVMCVIFGCTSPTSGIEGMGGRGVLPMHWKVFVKHTMMSKPAGGRCTSPRQVTLDGWNWALVCRDRLLSCSMPNQLDDKHTFMTRTMAWGREQRWSITLYSVKPLKMGSH